jgi:hypothetical protein
VAPYHPAALQYVAIAFRNTNIFFLSLTLFG